MTLLWDASLVVSISAPQAHPPFRLHDAEVMAIDFTTAFVSTVMSRIASVRLDLFFLKALKV